jgi:3-hydroxyacyl-CoA dehydrogenase / 3-hydroxy-2-methylbutyryl-CoA dehydrogenase
MDISNCVAIVTGGASGLGAGCCRRLLERGAKAVTILDLAAERGAALAEELGPRSLFIRTDVTDLDSVESAFSRANERFGAANVLIAAAGATVPAKLIGRAGLLPMEKFEAAMRINLYGTLHAIRTAVSTMVSMSADDDGERGVVICLSSGAAFEGQVGQIGYSASKAALVGMTLPLARELAGYGIRVVTIAPGAFDTPIYETMAPAVRASLDAQMLFPKRMGRPEELAMFVEEILRNKMHNGRTYRFDAGLILAP